ncbi:MAG: FtsX-like permease family protein, partial [Ginsengibacter sp.]
EMSANSDITYIYIFSFAAFFILLLAAVNFINISISQSFTREKEIGLRKVVGATKPQLIKQFLLESFLTTFLAVVLALILFESVIPYYEKFTQTTFQNTNLFTFPTLVVIVVLIISIGLIAGLYPALFISRFNPITSIKNKREYSSKTIRNGLIVFQFAVSVFMIVGTIVIYRQINLFHNKNLGFDKEQVLAITIQPAMRDNLFPLVNKIKGKTIMKDAALVSHIPGERFGTAPVTFPLSIADQNNTSNGVRAIWADENLLPTLHISLREGRNFYSQLPEIKKHEFILNQSAIQTFGLIKPVGQKINLDGEEGEIVGVVNDFNFASLHGGIEPLLIAYNPYNSGYILVKVADNKMPQALSQLKDEIEAISPDAVFSFTFIDEKLDQLYASENKMSAVFKGFALLSIIISCLGLFGLAAFVTKLRTKEIGIRKVLGASNFGITFLLSKEFMRLILLAIAIASPTAYFAMHEWLNGFAYHVEIDWWIFALAGSVSAFVAFITLGFYCIKAAIANPVKSLRTE